jgi:MFS transporter, DHA1 family, staphyloferrin A biosynthesis exporter
MHRGTGEREQSPRGGGFAALKNRDFRLLWIGSLIAHTGNWMQQVAQSWLLYDLTGSALLVGLNGLIRTVPFLVLSLYAGAMVDRLDRKKLLLWVQGIDLFITLGLGVLVASGHVQVWHIYLNSVLGSFTGAFQIPAQQALLPHLVPRKDLLGAVGLNSMLRKGTQIIGPSLGGICVAAFGVAETYFINVAAFTVLVGCIAAMRTTNPPAEPTRQGAFHAVLEGIRYVRGDAVIGSLLILEATLSVFGSFNSMLVVFARDVFAAGPQGLGLLQSAPGLGTVLGSIALASVGDIRNKGRLVIIGGVCYACFIVAFALCPLFPAALLLLGLAGASDIVVGSTRNTILQLWARGPMLGRVMSLHAMSSRGMGPLGGFQAGTLTQFFGVQHAIAIGASVCVLVTLAMAWRAPALFELKDVDREELREPAGHRS